MRHGKALRKFNRDSAHRKAMLNNLAQSLLKHEQIKTTLPKAKELRPYVEKLITAAKTDSVHKRRLLSKKIKEKDVLKKLFTDLGARFKDRNGGYIRIVKAGFRYGDCAPMAVIELVDKAA